jgi:heme oxygenase
MGSVTQAATSKVVPAAYSAASSRADRRPPGTAVPLRELVTAPSYRCETVHIWTSLEHVDVMLLANLKAQTHAQHRALEDQLKLPQRIVSRRELSAVLAALLAAWLPLERHLADARGWAEIGLDPHLGEATTLLRDDLGTLDQVSPSPPPGRSAVTPPFDTTARAAGGRYVLLGSAIGGRVLAPAIERRLGPGTAATRFFRRDGLDPRRDWRTFQAAMTSHPWSSKDTEQAISSARATFEFIAATARPLLIDRDFSP